MSRIRGYLAIAVASSALTALGGAGGLGAATRASAPANTSLPTVSGKAVAGQTLTASPGSWKGSTPISYGYRWRRCRPGTGSCEGIAGAGSTTYTLTSADVGFTVLVHVTAQNSAGQSAAESKPTGTVAADPNAPANTARPTITGQADVGSVLTGTDGSWSGKGPFTFTRRWHRCDANGNACTELGSTSARYRLGTDDLGHRMRFEVTAKNASGTGDATSDATAVVGGKPAAVTRPSVSGTAQQGQTLTGSQGTWNGTQPITLSVWWERCDQAGGSCARISGTSKTTYLVTNADVGRRLRFHVHAVNSRGAAGTSSAATAIVSAGAPPPPALPPGAVKLPDGTISIPVTSVSLPDQLIVDRVAFAPTVLRSRAPFQARFHVVDTKGYVVRDALVYMLGVPFGRILNVPEQPTAQDGWATVNVQPTAKLPLVRGGSLVVFVRARKPGDNVLAGVSARRLVQVGVSSAR
jgi:hypothetical protein